MLIIKTATNSHIATLTDGQVSGTVCKPAALPKKFTVVDSADTYAVHTEYPTPHLVTLHHTAVCNRCNKVSHSGR